MPTHYELETLYDIEKTYKSDCGFDSHLTDLIHLTCTAPWASETRDRDAAYFCFGGGGRNWAPQSNGRLRALPVRSGK
jgi:hypothetical protein